MLKEDVRPSSMLGIKRLANQIKKNSDISHAEALDRAARAASFENFAHARHAFANKACHGRGSILFLTYYWDDPEQRQVGRETLEVRLSRPLLDVCSKSDMKLVGVLSAMRMVAPDHLMMDDLSPTQDFAQSQLSQVGRALRFMEGTGLRPCTYERARKAKASLDGDLPRQDHGSDWFDPETGHYILIDEPYLDPVVDPERRQWAERNHWHLRAAIWPGIYSPHLCGFFVASPISQGYDFDRLMRRIDALAVVPRQWDGTSVADHMVFLSPLATTPQDRRRARAKGMIRPEPSVATLPYTGFGTGNRRRPNASMPVSDHRDLGRMIKAILTSQHKPWAVNRRMDRLRSTLEDWLNGEIRGEDLTRGEFFKIYYGNISDDDPHVATAASTAGVIELLLDVMDRLRLHYVDCAPLRRVESRIGTALKFIERAGKHQTTT